MAATAIRITGQDGALRGPGQPGGNSGRREQGHDQHQFSRRR